MNEIEQLLPHRKPFLFVEKLIEITEDKIVGEYTYTDEEFFFKGHFPQYPVVPGVVLVETLAQCGGAGLRKQGILGDNSLFFLASIDKVKLRQQVRPGDTVRLEVENLKVSRKIIKQQGKALVEGKVAAEASWMCIAEEADKLPV